MTLKFKVSDGNHLLPPGTYPGVLARVEQRAGGAGPYLMWTFILEGHGNRRVVGLSSVSFDPQAKARQWTELLIGRRLSTDEEVDVESLQGRRCRVVLSVKHVENRGQLNSVEQVLGTEEH